MSLAEILTPNNDTLYCANLFISGSTGPTGVVGGYAYTNTYTLTNAIVGVTGTYRVSRAGQNVTITIVGATGSGVTGFITVLPPIHQADWPTTQLNFPVNVISNGAVEVGDVSISTNGFIQFAPTPTVSGNRFFYPFFVGGAAINGFDDTSMSYVLGI
jgi:hypothetical protein